MLVRDFIVCQIYTTSVLTVKLLECIVPTMKSGKLKRKPPVEQPTLLWHGTSGKIAERILEEGILPNGTPSMTLQVSEAELAGATPVDPSLVYLMSRPPWGNTVRLQRSDGSGR